MESNKIRMTLLICVLLLPLFSSVHANSSSPSSSNNSTLKKSYKTFVFTHCNSTTYPYECFQSLTPHASAIQANPFKLCNVSLSLALKATTKSYSLISHLLTSSLNKTTSSYSSVCAVLKDCVSNVKDAVDEIRQSLHEMAHLKDDVDKAFHVSNIQTAVSAAITDNETCLDGFDDVGVDVAGMREKVRKSIVNVERMTSNALHFINANLNYY